ncbi:MAG: hypothetical protein ACK5OX_19890 [Desertimonas sp.]
MGTRLQHVVWLVSGLVLGAAVLIGPADSLAAPAVAPRARLIAEWDPGWSAAEAGGRFSVDGYGVGGLGAYRVQLDDGAVVAAVCVQADIGHSMTAEYAPDPSPTVMSPELDYLLWRLVDGDDLTAAAVNVLAWRYSGAVRSGGGPIWSGGPIAIAVDGVGARDDIEDAVSALGAEASRRRGPWMLAGSAGENPEAGDRHDVAVTLSGPGGPIADVVVTFEHRGGSVEAITDGQGVARVDVDGDAGDDASGAVVARVSSPGPAQTWSAPGSQRVAIAGPAVALTVELDLPAPSSTTTTTTTTSTTTSTSPSTTTSTSPSTTITSTSTSTSTTAAPTASSSTTSTGTTAAPTPPTAFGAPPTTAVTQPTTAVVATAPSTGGATPTLPVTGGGGRGIARAGAWAVALGGVAVWLTARRRTADG